MQNAQVRNISEIARAMGVKGVDDMSVEEYRKAAVDAVQQAYLLMLESQQNWKH